MPAWRCTPRTSHPPSTAGHSLSPQSKSELTFFLFFLFVCFTRYLAFRRAVLTHRPGVVYYQLFLRRETRIPGVAFSYHVYKGRRQNSLPLTIKLSRNVTEPSKGISYPVSDLCQSFTKLTVSVPLDYIVIRYPEQMVQMVFL